MADVKVPQRLEPQEIGEIVGGVAQGVEERGGLRGTITPTLYQPSAFEAVTRFTARIRTPAVPRRCISSR